MVESFEQAESLIKEIAEFVKGHLSPKQEERWIPRKEEDLTRKWCDLLLEAAEADGLSGCLLCRST